MAIEQWYPMLQHSVVFSSSRVKMSWRNGHSK